MLYNNDDLSIYSLFLRKRFSRRSPFSSLSSSIGISTREVVSEEDSVGDSSVKHSKFGFNSLVFRLCFLIVWRFQNASQL